MEKRAKKFNLPYSIVSLQRDYITKILESCSGMKALIFDDITLKMVSMVFMQSEGFKRDAFLVENIKFMGDEKLASMVGIFIISATNETIQKIKLLLKDPIFKEYHLFFTSKIDDHIVRMLAEADEFDKVKRFQEVPIEYCAVTPEMMITGIPTTLPLTKPSTDWKENENTIIKRMSYSLTDFILSLRRKPSIRYLAGSQSSEALAVRVKNLLAREITSQPKEFEKDRSTLIILERKEDPVTPLVFDWSYISMVHECFGLDGNKTQVSGKDYNMYIEDDQFLKENLYSNYGEVASNLKDFLQEVANKKKQNLNIEKFEDMQKIINSMPDLKRDASNVNKHVDITGDISKQMNIRGLLEIGELEQTMLTKDNRTESYKVILAKFDDPGIKLYDLLRLVIMYCIRYEGDKKAIELQELVERRLNEEKPAMKQIVNNMLSYAGKSKRNNTFLLDNLADKLKGRFKQYFKNVPNVFCLYRPYLETLFEDAYRGRLKESTYVSTDPSADITARNDTVFIYIIGGVTYIESRIIFELRQKYPDVDIYLGGSHVLNSKSFLAEMMNFGGETNLHHNSANPFDL